MPFALGWEPRGVIITYSGTLVPEEVLECHRQVARDPRFDDLRFAIVDTLPIQSISLSRTDVEQIDAFLQGPARTNPNIKVVFVATHADVLQALAHYQALGDRAYQAIVCASNAAARASVVARADWPPRPRGLPR